MNFYHEVTDYRYEKGHHLYRFFDSQHEAVTWIGEQSERDRKSLCYIHRVWHGNHFNYEANKGRIRIMSRDEGNTWIERMPPKQNEFELVATPAVLAQRAATQFAESAAAELKKAQQEKAQEKASERPRINRHKMALDVQDAGNLRAIARSFVEVCDDAMWELQATTSVWRDPAVILFAAKIAELTGCGYADMTHYSKAYEACKAQQKEAVWR